MSSTRVTKAVLPAAGLSTRHLPAAKAQPKAMFPVVDKPAIQYVVEEAVDAGLNDILIVTGRGTRAIEDHFDRAVELEVALEAKGKLEELKLVREITDMATIHYVRQREAKGLGHAVSVARQHVGDEPFAVLLPDDLMTTPVLAGMLEVHERTGRPVLALMEVGPDEISAYGCAAIEQDADGLVRVTGLIEKPDPGEAPSNLAVMGRYLLTSDIFGAIERVVPGKGGEIQVTDAIALLIEDGVYGYTFTEGRYDTGNKLDYLKTIVEYALVRDDLGPDFLAFLREVTARTST
ncbi:MAG: UTP--glucose-1-phosphate uridylyltransferase GalU [Actinomycetota bacterium]|nr:UTP--glucose-1-phosphate uridylyltransferase GalU [Actinomycetota bacterium]